jgi:hypothetical protein
VSWHDNEEERQVFGVPAVLVPAERTSLLSDLTMVWMATYGQAMGVLSADLELCRMFFDPLARGHKLRERLINIQPMPKGIVSRLEQFGEPLTINAGEDVLLVGVEARLVVDLLRDLEVHDSRVISREQVAQAEHLALKTYRKWSLGRLRQVIDLRAGTGSEVMQAVAVGIVLALLINRSDTPSRAVIQWDYDTPDGKEIDKAVFAGAEQFASNISSRSGRSSSEQRLKGGYGLTEARRRLAHRLVVARDSGMDGVRIYIPEEYRNEVITFIARDLARRSTLTTEKLAVSFDQLVVKFESSARALAYRSMIFERPADTVKLRRQLIEEFEYTRGK